MRHSSFTAVYDACVLYPAPLRDFLMWLALSGLYRARWTEEIHCEWKRNLLKNRPDLTIEQLDRTSQLMDLAIPDACVDSYEDLIVGLSLPDDDDRHVLAAAIRCGADVIVTFNLKDFPIRSLEPFGIEAQHPDEFVENLFIWIHPRSLRLPKNSVNTSRPQRWMWIVSLLFCNAKAWTSQ